MNNFGVDVPSSLGICAAYIHIKFFNVKSDNKNSRIQQYENI